MRMAEARAKSAESRGRPLYARGAVVMFPCPVLSIGVSHHDFRVFRVLTLPH